MDKVTAKMAVYLTWNCPTCQRSNLSPMVGPQNHEEKRIYDQAHELKEDMAKWASDASVSVGGGFMPNSLVCAQCMSEFEPMLDG